ncbi:MAG: hypothetical protein ABEI52_00230, partial [Halobacteriaceae archaeon]
RRGSTDCSLHCSSSLIVSTLLSPGRNDCGHQGGHECHPRSSSEPDIEWKESITSKTSHERQDTGDLHDRVD